MSISISLHRVKYAAHVVLHSVENDALEFSDGKGGTVQLFVPPHVARTVARAFNSAIETATQPDTPEPTEADQGLIPIPEGYAEQ